MTGSRSVPAARRAVAILLVVTLALGSVPGLAAGEFGAGGAVVVGADETITADLDVAAGAVVIRGTVEGDVRAVGGSVLVAGRVTGRVEAVGGDVTVSGVVGDRVEVVAGSVAVSDGARIGGDLEAAAGTVTVAGTVDGDARLAGRPITLAPSARIGGDLVHDGALDRDPDASVAGTVRRGEGLRVGSPFGGRPLSRPPGAGSGLYGLLANLALGAILIGAFPRFSTDVAARARRNPYVAGVAAIVVLLGVPALLVLLALTVVGLPVALVGAALFVVGLWIGAIYGRYAVGAWLLTFTAREGRWPALLLGVVVVALVGRIPIVGELLGGFVLLVGIGALVLALVHAFRGRPRGPDTQPGSPTG